MKKNKNIRLIIRYLEKITSINFKSLRNAFQLNPSRNWQALSEVVDMILLLLLLTRINLPFF
ncbi:hypothetical protein L579_3744 [Pantoea sp. AS-PWVM4]|nr:hypothetical protein L579_3744 [Pantoea sp. AS-PWVM4]